MTIGLRARAAAANLSIAALGFNPGQKRGPDGRWIKGGGGVAAPPPDAPPAKRTAKKTTPAARRAGAAGWLDSAGGRLSPEVQQQVGQMFNYEDPQTGLRAEVREVRASGMAEYPSIVVRVRVLNASGAEVGRADRTIEPDRSGGPRPVVRHASFNLNGSAQGGGFSSRWLAQMEQRYRDAGIGKITISTEKIGGYAWAKAGFDFASRRFGPDAMGNRFKRALGTKAAQRDLPQRVITDGLELVRRSQSKDPDEKPLPMEFAMLGWTPGAEAWFGKETMIGSQWAGEKEL